VIDDGVCLLDCSSSFVILATVGEPVVNLSRCHLFRLRHHETWFVALYDHVAGLRYFLSFALVGVVIARVKAFQHSHAFLGPCESRSSFTLQ